MTDRTRLSRLAIAGLVVVFVATRAAGVWVSIRPEGYGPDVKVTLDYELYEERANDILDDTEMPYRDVDLEYPPGALIQLLLPGIADRDPSDYRAIFIVVCVLIDTLALFFLTWLASRWGSLAGPWVWTVGLALLGPLAYARLDLFPALATIIAAERAAAAAWGWSGAWMAIGAMTKIYPALLMPAAAVGARDRPAWLRGVAIGAGLLLLPFVFVLPDLYHDVFGYHGERGIQIESLWGAGIFVAIRNGYSLIIDSDFGAYHFNGGVVPAMKLAASVATVGAAAWGAWALRRSERVDTAASAQVMFPVLAVAIAAGTVLSPQYLIWLLGIASIALCSKESPLRVPAYILCGAALLTHALFPFLYNRLQAIEAVPIFVLMVRDLALVLVALWSVIVVRRWLRDTASASDDAIEPAA